MTLKTTLFIFTLLISSVSFGQRSEAISGDLSPIFDISPDNKNIVLSVSNGENSILYVYSLTENKLNQLTDAKGYYVRPVYSPKGDKIIFLSKDLNSGISDVCSLSLDDKQIKKLTGGKIYVTEASFLQNGNEIIYCGAGAITNYSPIARKAPHDLDLYSIGQDGNNSKKLTNFHAYQFSGISPNRNGDTLLCKLIIKGVEGIYLVSLADTTQTKLEAVNNPRPEIGESFYGTPAFSKDNKYISFTAPYQLYVMNLTDKKCEEIWSSFGKEEQAMPIFSRFDGTDKRVIFSVLAIINRQYSQKAQFYSSDLTTKKTTQISIPVKN